MQKQLILIVEDDPEIRGFLADILTTLGGYEVLTLDSIFGADDIVRRLRPAAILLDIGLPFRSGTDLLDQLKAERRTADVPVIIVSGLVEILSEHRRAQAAAVIGKPIDAGQLLAVLREVLTLPGRGASEPPSGP